MAILAETRQSDFSTRQRLATCCTTDENLLGNAEMGSPTHPPYSPDLAPSDYHLFRSIAHDLTEQHFHSYEDAKKWVDL